MRLFSEQWVLHLQITNELQIKQNFMITKALLAKLSAKPGKEKEVEAFLKSALPIVLKEKDTVTWYAIKFSATSFGIFDTFTGDEGRQAHLSGEVAKALMASAPHLFAEDPLIDFLEVLAFK